MDRYQTAVEMYKQEHTRWYQWALFFSGSVGSVFVVGEKLHVLVWIQCVISAIVSFMWVLAGINIRLSTKYWLKTIKEIEQEGAENPVKPFVCFDEKMECDKRWQELWRILCPCGNKTMFSVTAQLVRLGILAFIVFAVFTVFWFVWWVRSAGTDNVLTEISFSFRCITGGRHP